MDPITPGMRLPHTHDAEPNSVEMASNGQYRTADVGRDERSIHSAPSSVAEHDIGQFLPETSSWVELGEGDVGEAQTNFDIKPVHTHTDNALPEKHSYSTPGIEESGCARLEVARASLVLEPLAGKANVVDQDHAPNIIVFGEAGVGKSSIINLISGQKRAQVSNDALGCTFEYEKHFVTLGGTSLALWDTTGLDEGSEGSVPARIAENNLRVLMQQLAHSGGIHLVIYCIRGSRLTKALKRNYDLFYVTVCQKKVSVALVVTGLEHQEGEMETWWTANEASLRRNGMRFDAHVCVTTLDVDDADIQTRRLDSRRRLHDLLAEYSRRHPWKIEASLISSLFRNILPGVSSKPTRRVIIYDDTTVCRTDTRLIGDRQLEYELVYVNNPLTPPSGKSPGVLVFYTSPLLDTGISPNDLAFLKSFHYAQATGEKTCPVIVVLRGCDDDEVARTCWVDVSPRFSDIPAWPIADEQSQLYVMIEKRCTERVEVKPWRLRRVYEIIMEFLQVGR